MLYEVITTFRRYPYSLSGGTGPAGEWVEGLFETADSTLWVLTNLGLCRYAEATDSFEFTPQKDAIPGLNDQEIFHVEEGSRIWFISNGLLFISYNFV